VGWSVLASICVVLHKVSLQVSFASMLHFNLGFIATQKAVADGANPYMVAAPSLRLLLLYRQQGLRYCQQQVPTCTACCAVIMSS
jgi:hypothetical protein